MSNSKSQPSAPSDYRYYVSTLTNYTQILILVFDKPLQERTQKHTTIPPPDFHQLASAGVPRCLRTVRYGNFCHATPQGRKRRSPRRRARGEFPTRGSWSSYQLLSGALTGGCRGWFVADPSWTWCSWRSLHLNFLASFPPSSGYYPSFHQMVEL